MKQLFVFMFPVGGYDIQPLVIVDVFHYFCQD